MLKPPSPLASQFVLAIASGALPGWDVDALLDALAVTGITALEVSVGPTGLIPAGDLQAARALKERLAHAGVSVCGADATRELTFVSPQAPQVLSSAAALDAGFARFFAPQFRPERKLDEQLNDARQALASLTDFAQSLLPKVAPLVEIAPGTLAASPELARRLVASNTSINCDAATRPAVVFDPGNMVAEGHLQPSFAVAILGDLLQHVHVKNRLIAEVDGSWSASSQTLAKGLVDWRSTVKALNESGYRGAYTLDHLSGLPSLESLVADVAEFRAVLAESLEVTN